jgi:hypothetical protein
MGFSLQAALLALLQATCLHAHNFPTEKVSYKKDI